jgi:hypothetical protein
MGLLLIGGALLAMSVGVLGIGRRPTRKGSSS